MVNTAQKVQGNADVPNDPARWTEFLRGLQERCFVVGPMSDFRRLPDGFEVRPTYISLEVGADSFKVGTEGRGDGAIEQHALSKSGIEKLALAAGAVAKTVRVDDRRDPMRCEYEATACMKLLDGSPQYAQASREYNLNPEGSDYVEVYDKAYEKAIRYPDKGLAGDEIEKAADFAGRRAVAAARATMGRNCESKAKLRALRSLLGLRSKYSAQDLRNKPFVVLKLHFNGHSEDPVLRRQFAGMIATQFLGVSSAMFGPAPVSRALAAPAEPTPQALPHDPEPDVEPDAGVDQATGEVATPPATAPAPSPDRVVPKGLPGEGRAIDALDDQVLEQLQTTIMQRLSAAQASGKVAPERLKSAETFLDAVTTLRDARRGPGAAAPAAPGGDDQWLADLNGEGARA